jgi:peptidoglycan/xylan/chitin deacetylase (PgdA/CDA1 family)
MDSNDEEAEQAASLILRSLWLTVSLVACNDIQKGKLLISHASTQVSSQQPAEPPKKKPVKKKKKKIYLTFDDGPNKGTPKVLHIIEEEKVPASFFLVGEHAEGSPTQRATFDSLEAEDVDLCNHSYSHAHNRYEAFYSDPEEVVNDFKRCRDSLKFNNDIARTPGRNCWRIDSLQYTDLKRSKAAVDSLQQAGFTLIGWDLEWHYDPKTFTVSNSADELITQIDSVFEHNKTRTISHLVLLAHDQVYTKPEDSAELHMLVKKLKDNLSYELAPISEYPGVKK